MAPCGLGAGAVSQAAKRVRVLQVIPSLEVAGAEMMVTHLARALDRARFDVTVLLFFDPAGSPLARMLRDENIPVVALGKGLGFDLTTFWRFECAMRRLKPDVVHTHLGVVHYVLPSLAIRRRVARVHTLHILAEEEAAFPLANRLAVRCGIRPVAIAEAVAASARRFYGIESPRIIPNGIPIAKCDAATEPRDSWREKEGIATSEFVFVNVGRLMEQKNQRLLIHAFARVCEDVRAVTLLIAGEGPLRRDLEESARELGVAARVRFLGLRQDVPSLLRAGDAFVLSSDSEGNPLCVMEAMAASLPVVSTAVGGVPELVENGRSGLLVDRGDAEGLAAAMRATARDPGHARAMGDAGRRRASERFDVAVMAQSYEALYLEELARCAAPGGRTTQ